MTAQSDQSAPKGALPKGGLVSWYGDDFTGSAAVMEVLTFAGLPSVLFLDIPNSEQLAMFDGLRGIGIAGTARSHSPDWMEKHLPPVFRFLQSLGAAIQHYKICSTLDSSPTTGSIGKAIDLAQRVFSSPWVPLFIAAPAIRRFQAFGNLFAAGPGGVFRLDRHPVMAQHPVTPMTEAEIARHLSKQTDKPFGLVSIEHLQTPQSAQSRLEKQRNAGAQIIALDCIDDKTLARVGQLIWQNRDGADHTLFVVGSQGIEYALVAYWKQTGLLPPASEPAGAGACENIIVVSGSVSQVTHRQIAWAEDHGFEAIAFDPILAIQEGRTLEAAIERLVGEAIDILERGKSPIVFTARGPDDSAVTTFRTALESSGVDAQQAQNNIGSALGRVLASVLQKTSVSRAIICGGDTSGHALRQLSIFALTALAPTIPGAALFSAHSNNPQYHNLQLALKGGQMGSPDYFQWIKKGGGAENQARNLT